MKQVYCSECGTKLPIIRKAMSKYATIIEIVEPHTCPNEMVEFDLKPDPVQPFVQDVKGKFVRKLNELQPPITQQETGDKRPKDQVKQTSSAPISILDQMRSLRNSQPEGDISRDLEEDD